eukprot:gnl/TRDRNA2_/TRDRNA2_186263_c0_seq1.p1 gnl/TRDRNA2_/TRDRNA2_186263_c0~~gnl/TRDRNA2_/TRDRNA2_186263_c0_seq1.p1  ORF type:complete len:942 (-),score=284.44 gnl/TRDRNA2_/TRDRNA2_186263_c0_seq1:71-2896(-)
MALTLGMTTELDSELGQALTQAQDALSSGSSEAQEGIKIVEELGATYGEVLTMMSIADLQATGGADAAATRLKACKDSGYRWGEALESLTVAFAKKSYTEVKDALTAARKQGLIWAAVPMLSLAEYALSSGGPDGAQASADEMLKAFKKAGNAEGEASVSLVEAIIALAKGTPEDAAAPAKKAKDAFAGIGSKEGKGAALQAEAEVLLAKGDLSAAMATATDALQIFRELHSLKGQAALLSTVIKVMLSKADFSDAFRNLLDLTDVTGRLFDRKEEAACLNMTANVLMTMAGQGVELSDDLKAMIGDALGASKKALLLARSFGSPKDIVAAMHTVANTYIGRKEHSDALTVTNEMLELARGSKDKLGEASALLTLANVRAGMRDEDQAIAKAKDALKLFRELADADGEAACLSTLGSVYTLKEGDEKALELLSEEQTAHFKSEGNKAKEAAVLNMLASAQIALEPKSAERAAAATKAAEKAADLYKDVNDTDGQACATAMACYGMAAQGDADGAVKKADGLKGPAAELAKAIALVSKNTAADATVARKSAESAQSSFASSGDKSGEASALHVIASAHLLEGNADAALGSAKESAALFKELNDMIGEACALHAATNAALMKENNAEAAIKYAVDALLLFKTAGDASGEASTLLMIASMHLSCGDSKQALSAAEQAMAHYLMTDNKKQEMLAAHLVAQAHLANRAWEQAIASAAQSIVLAKEVGDKCAEAAAIYTTSNAQIMKYVNDEGVNNAKKAAKMFGDMRLTNAVSACEILQQQSKERTEKVKSKIPRAIMSLPAVSGMEGRFGAGMKDTLSSRPQNLVVWGAQIGDTPYITYCLELCKLVDSLGKSTAAKAPVLIMSRGTHGRPMGEMLPGSMKHVNNMTIWAVMRTVRLEQPRLHIATVDVPAHEDAIGVGRCLLQAQQDSGARQECTFASNMPIQR